MEQQLSPRQQHKILSHPVLGAILLILWCLVLSNLCSFTVLISEEAGNIGTIAAAFLALGIHRWWFREEYKGSFRSGWLSYPDVNRITLVVVLLTLVTIAQEYIRNGVATPTLNAVLLAIGAGTFEEAAFRALPDSLMMRDYMDEKHIPFVAAFSAVLFGLIHALNLFQGATVSYTILQVCQTIAIGFFMASLYLRTGNVLPCMLFHVIYDMLAMMSVGNANGPGSSSLVMADFLVGFCLSSVFVVGGVLLIKNHTKDILDIFRERWSVDAPSMQEVKGPADLKQL